MCNGRLLTGSGQGGRRRLCGVGRFFLRSFLLGLQHLPLPEADSAALLLQVLRFSPEYELENRLFVSLHFYQFELQHKSGEAEASREATDMGPIRYV